MMKRLTKMEAVNDVSRISESLRITQPVFKLFAQRTKSFFITANAKDAELNKDLHLTKESAFKTRALIAKFCYQMEHAKTALTTRRPMRMEDLVCLKSAI